MDVIDGASEQPALPFGMLRDQPGGTDRFGSKVLRMAVGAQLRRRREAARVSPEQAAYLIRSSGAKVSRMELGRHRFKERDLVDLLALYRVDGAEQEEFLDLARQANVPGWWQRYRGLLPSWFETYVAMEHAASVIRTFEVQFVPGLLQTDEYARTVFRLAHNDPDEVERRVDLRRRRQELLTSANAPQLWAGSTRPPSTARSTTVGCAARSWRSCSSSTSCRTCRCRSPPSAGASIRRRAALSRSCVFLCRTARCGLPRAPQRCVVPGQGVGRGGLRRHVAPVVHADRPAGRQRVHVGANSYRDVCGELNGEVGDGRLGNGRRPHGRALRSHVELLPGRQGQLPGRPRYRRRAPRDLPRIRHQGAHMPLLPLSRGPVPHGRGRRAAVPGRRHGAPAAENTHQVAQQFAPESRVVYVDNDPLVLAHARSLLTSSPEGTTCYIDADLREPGRILAEARASLDFREPIALLLLGVLGHLADYEQALGTVRRLLDGLPPGSYLVQCDGTTTDASYVKALAEYR